MGSAAKLEAASSRRSRACEFALVLVLCLSGAVHAENVDPDEDGSQYAWGEHLGWLNAEPQGDGAMGVQVADAGLTGWIWAEHHGWISLSCQNTSSCGQNAYGVVNDGRGNLSGFAWGERLGWIRFDPGDGSDCCVANGTPGCRDTACEAVICPDDPYCCNNNWDGICAGSASVEPACSPVCADDPWGVRIHGFTGEFSGDAWTEHDGWINFGSAPVAATHQIETAWRCPDGDTDGVCSASDNCADWPNPLQDSVLFGQSVRAASNKVDFVWSTPVEWLLATGTFTDASSIGTYTVDFFASGFGTVYTDLGFPSAGFGYWYLFRPDCPAGSYSTGTETQQGDRDGALIP
jgi:hypothetical protein